MRREAVAVVLGAFICVLVPLILHAWVAVYILAGSEDFPKFGQRSVFCFQLFFSSLYAVFFVTGFSLAFLGRRRALLQLSALRISCLSLVAGVLGAALMLPTRGAMLGIWQPLDSDPLLLPFLAWALFSLVPGVVVGLTLRCVPVFMRTGAIAA